MGRLDPAEAKLLGKQTEIHLMEACIALSKASDCAIESPEIYDEICKAYALADGVLRGKP